MVATLALLPARPLAAQLGTTRQQCELVRNNFVRSIQAGEGNRITYISGPAFFQCRDGTRIRADSAVEFTASRFRQLIGGVEIDQPGSNLRAGRVHQFTQVGRIEAWDDVVVVDSAQGARILGDTLRLYRADQNRPEDEMTVWGETAHAVVRLTVDDSAAAAARDTATAPADTAAARPDPTRASADTTLPAPDTAGSPDTARTRPDTGAAAPDTAAVDTGAARPDTRAIPASSAPPDTVYADRFHLRGRTAFRAGGSVRIRREAFRAFSDSLEYLRDAGDVTLVGEPRIEGDAFDLEGDLMNLVLGPEGVRYVRARRAARLTGRDVRLTAPEIRVFLSAGEIDRLVAVRGPDSARAVDTVRTATASLPPEGAERSEAGPAEAADSAAPASDSATAGARPVARSEEFVLEADSIEVVAPGQELERIFAAGRARGESLGRDSLNTESTPEIARRDWIEGNTVVAHFQPVDASRPAIAGRGMAAAADSSEARYRLDRLVATGSARSLYRLVPRDSAVAGPADTARVAGADEAGESANEGAEEASSDTASADAPGESASSSPAADTARARPPGRLALHYVTGDEITIVLREGAVQQMDVVGQTRGLYLEPGRAAPGPGGMPGSVPSGAGTDVPPPGGEP